ncbi:MAG: hypothetical protein KF847_03320 [Pirellulales bacterium]|nr:hypothetical protein [Pirellulales bacterium]
MSMTTNLSTAPQERCSVPEALQAPPQLYRCLAVSLLEQRRRLIELAALDADWLPVVVADGSALVRQAFLFRADLLWIDLPENPCSADESQLNLEQAVESVLAICPGLLVVSGSDASGSEETWARSMGAWAYLPEARTPLQLTSVFSDVRNAIRRLNARRDELESATWRGS